MCGIYGYIGDNRAYPELIAGLKLLEYRGYDSCGIAVVENNTIEVVRAIGRPCQLPELQSVSTIGIGHTRWATHGKVSVDNAHPHTCYQDIFSLVHNGVIENYDVIKRKLVRKGIVFKSETDTEVLVHLISYYYNQTKSFSEAVDIALSEISGAYGIAVICKREPGTIICASKSSPIVLCKTDSSIHIASDICALSKHKNDVIILQSGQVATVTRGSVVVKGSTGEVKPTVKKITVEYVEPSIQGYSCFMEKEIYEQPDVIRNALRGRIDESNGSVKFGGIDIQSNINRILFIGCGTAYHAGLIGKYFIEEIAGIPASVEYSSEVKYKQITHCADTLVIPISQSGETFDTLAATEEILKKGLTVLAVTNTVDSSLARLVGMGIYQHAGPEISVASTKAFTSQITILMLLAIYLGIKRGMPADVAREYMHSLNSLPKLVEECLRLTDTSADLTDVYRKTKSISLLGRHLMYPIAIEGALKIKELLYIDSHGYPAGELKHGPLASISNGSSCFFFAPQKELREKNISNMKEICARDGHILLITQEGIEFPEDTYDNVIYIPKSPVLLQPILSIIPIQLFCLKMAQDKGYDVDRPRHLAKSVTVE